MSASLDKPRPAASGFSSVIGRFIAHRPYTAFSLFALVVVGYRLWVIAATEFPLFYDEAYYLDWARDLDWGYYSKPPMVALILKLFTGLLGETSLGVKAGAALGYAFSSMLVLLIGRYLYNPRVGAAAGIVYLSLPIVGGNSFFMTTDVPLIFFWSLTLLLFLYARDRGGWVWWLAMGVAIGAGILSKYTMIALVPGLLIYLVSTPAHRHWLRRPQLWTALLVSVLVFLPNVLWNAAHDFISFRHTAEISHLDSELLKLGEGVAFVAAQFGVMGPLLMPFFIRVAATRASYLQDESRLLLLVALPLLGVITLQAFLAGANYNWAAPAYVTATLVTVAYLAVHGRQWLVRAVVFNLALLSLLYHYHPVTDTLGVQLTRNMDPYYRLLGWREAADKVKPWLDAHPDAMVAGDTRDVMAYLSYYAQAHKRGLAAWNPQGDIDHHYELMFDVARYPDADFVYISKRKPTPDLLDRFEEAEPLGEIEVGVYPDYSIRLYGVWLHGFKGYR